MVVEAIGVHVAERTQISGADMAWVGPAIGAVGSIAGGGLSFLGQSNANASNSAFNYQQLANQQAQFDQQMAFAREQFNTGGFVDIQNRINAAKAFGVSPLAALGAPSFSPTAIPVGTIGGGMPEGNSLGSLGEGLSQAGQSIGRAIGAAKTAEEREQEALRILISKQTLEKNQADIDLIRAQTASVIARTAQGPAFPSVVGDTGQVIPGQGNSRASSPGGVTMGSAGGYVNEPPSLPTHNPEDRGTVSGRAGPMGIYRMNNRGALVYEDAPGTQAATIGGWTTTENWVRNRLLPYMGYEGAAVRPPLSEVQKAYPTATGTTWSSRDGGWVPTFGGRRSEYGLDEDARRSMYYEMRTRR